MTAFRVWGLGWDVHPYTTALSRGYTRGYCNPIKTVSIRRNIPM